MNTKKLYSSILLLFVLFCAIGCMGKRSEQASDHKQDSMAVQNPATTVPVSNYVLLDTAATVKGDQTQKYTLSSESDGTYTFVATSKNTGMVFVIQDSDGNNVIDETFPAWTGELKKGDYTLIIGLTRNAARKNMEKEVGFSILVKKDK